MNKQLADAVKRLAADSPLTWQFIGADERLYTPCDFFMSFHMDGSTSATARGWSMGYPAGTAEAERVVFANRLKLALQGLGGRAETWRNFNYTSGLRNFYGYKSSYSHTAPHKYVLEAGFITNPDDLQFAEENRERIAAVLVDEIHALFGVAEEPLTPEPEEAEVTDSYSLDEGFKQIREEGTGWAVELYRRMLSREGVPTTSAALSPWGPADEAAHRQWAVSQGLQERAKPTGTQWRRMLRLVMARPEPAEAGGDVLELEAQVAELQEENETLERQLADSEAANLALDGVLEAKDGEIRRLRAVLLQLDKITDEAVDG